MRQKISERGKIYPLFLLQNVIPSLWRTNYLYRLYKYSSWVLLNRKQTDQSREDLKGMSLKIDCLLSAECSAFLELCSWYRKYLTEGRVFLEILFVFN